MKNISSLEMSEYLLATTSAKVALRVQNQEAIVADLRAALRLHRFQVMNWLMANGVGLPTALLDDRLHPEPGEQAPDQPVGG